MTFIIIIKRIKCKLKNTNNKIIYTTKNIPQEIPIPKPLIVIENFWGDKIINSNKHCIDTAHLHIQYPPNEKGTCGEDFSIMIRSELLPLS